jgi:hypothetical protein
MILVLTTYKRIARIHIFFVAKLGNWWLLSRCKAGLLSMCVIFLLIDIARRNEEVKRCLKVLLGIVEEGLPSIPASCAEGAGWVN